MNLWALGGMTWTEGHCFVTTLLLCLHTYILLRNTAIHAIELAGCITAGSFFSTSVVTWICEYRYQNRQVVTICAEKEQAGIVQYNNDVSLNLSRHKVQACVLLFQVFFQQARTWQTRTVMIESIWMFKSKSNNKIFFLMIGISVNISL